MIGAGPIFGVTCTVLRRRADSDRIVRHYLRLSKSMIGQPPSPLIGPDFPVLGIRMMR
jgi:hypothetical protein